jgi:hypothetical protein
MQVRVVAQYDLPAGDDHALDQLRATLRELGLDDITFQDEGGNTMTNEPEQPEPSTPTTDDDDDDEGSADE